MATENTGAPGRNVGWGVFGDDFDNLFEGFFRPLGAVRSEDGTHAPAVDVTEDDKSYVIKADLPGVKKEDIEVTVHDGVLTITASTASESEEKKDGRVIRQERRMGRFSRALRLGGQVDDAKLSATYGDGVLSVVLPKVAAATPRKISIEPR